MGKRLIHTPIFGPKPPAGKHTRAIAPQIEYHLTMSEHNSTTHSADDPQPSRSNPRPEVRQPSVMLSDLTGDLLWTRVLRAPAMAMGPSRLVSGFVCAFLLAAVLELISQLGLFRDSYFAIADGFAPLAQLFSGVDLVGLPVALLAALWLVIVAIRDSIFHYPLASLTLGVPMIAILSVVGGAISRSVAIEFAHGRFASRSDTLGFALRRGRAFLGAVLGPVIFCTLALLALGVGGLLLSLPVLDVVGSLLYGLGLLLGLLVTLVLMLHLVALPLIVPALAVEGTDAFDAVQRSYAYVIAKPIRYLVYALLLGLLGLAAAVLFSFVARSAVEMTNWGLLSLSGDSALRTLSGEGEQGATKSTAHAIINIWSSGVWLAIAGYMISLFFTCSTLLYLVIRRLCDGQDLQEIWEETP